MNAADHALAGVVMVLPCQEFEGRVVTVPGGGVS